MADQPPVPFCYVGDGLGGSPVTPIPRRQAAIEWNQYDRRVRMVPGPEVDGFVEANREHFRRCVPLADGYGGFTADQLAALGDKGIVHVEQYNPKNGSDPVPMLVLDEITAAGLAAQKPPKKGKE